jgi:hypothetical protein
MCRSVRRGILTGLCFRALPPDAAMTGGCSDRLNPATEGHLMSKIKPKTWLIGTGVGAVVLMAAIAFTGSSTPTRAETIRLVQSPWCACCDVYADDLRRQGWSVTIELSENLAPVKRLAGVPQELQSCHTAAVGGYAVEGHVPNEAIERLLTERPRLSGIALPGMPPGSPGMGGTASGPFEIHGFTAGSASGLFMRTAG